MMNIQNKENEEEITREADCTVTDINNDKYTLDCTAKDKNTYNLQSAISIIDNDILLVNNYNIENYEEEAILVPYKGDDVQSIRYFSKRSKRNWYWCYCWYCLACFVALASVIAAILCLRKTPNHVTDNNSDLVNKKYDLSLSLCDK